MDVMLRAAERCDLGQVLALWTQVDAAPRHTDNLGSLQDLIRHAPGALIVAVDDEGQIVGSVIAAWDGWRGSIYRLAVAPDYQRQGLGRRLLAAAEQRLASVGAVRSQAIVAESDPQALAFWHASGWQLERQQRRLVKG